MYYFFFTKGKFCCSQIVNLLFLILGAWTANQPSFSLSPKPTICWQRNRCRRWTLCRTKIHLNIHHIYLEQEQPNPLNIVLNLLLYITENLPNLWVCKASTKSLCPYKCSTKVCCRIVLIIHWFIGIK